MAELVRHRYTVTLDGAEPFEVLTSLADQTVYEQTRQRRKWPLISEGGVNFWTSFTAWSAAKRTGQIDGLTYEQFADRVVSLQTDDDEGEPVDPTPPDQPGS